MRIKIFIAWYDFWIGIFYDRKSYTFYICLLPCVVLKIQFTTFPKYSNEWSKQIETWNKSK